MALPIPLFTNAVKASDIRFPGRPDLANAIKLDLGTIPMTNLMMRTGMEIDLEHLKALSSRIGTQMGVVSKEVQNFVPQSVLDKFVIDSINLESSEQVSDLLFNALGIGRGQKLKMTKGGGKRGERASTGKKQMETFREAHEVMPLMLEYRELSKLKSTYVDKMPRIVVWHPKGPECPLCGLLHWTDSPRIHTSVVGTRTATGRYSSRNPNLQNIPTRTKLGQEVRAAFVAGEGYKLDTCDYSQIELRLLAHFACELNMIVVFIAGGDLHTHTASLVFEKPPELVDPIFERMPCKNLNFAIAYSETEVGMSKQMMTIKPPPHDPRSKTWTELWSVENCAKFIEKWHEAYPAIKPFMLEQFYRARRYGFVWDLFGGVRRIPQARSYHEHVREEGNRAAGNDEIQGTASGVMKLSMVLLGETVDERLEWSRPLMTIHDELLFQVDEDKAETECEFIKMKMEEAGDMPGFRVPIKADGKVSKEDETGQSRWKK